MSKKSKSARKSPILYHSAQPKSPLVQPNLLAAFGQKISKLIRHNWLLICLLLFAALTRLPYAVEGIFPFSFDHGKDMIAVMHMVETHTLKLIGPWTSIPGVFFGPAWYYLLAPAYILTSGNPIGAVVTMIILSLIQIFLVKKFYGWGPAVIATCASGWTLICKSAWNPWPLATTSFLIMILLDQIQKYDLGPLNPKNQRRLDIYTFLTGLIASLGFHFSAAFAIFYPPCIGLILILRKTTQWRRKLPLLLIGFIIPFLPQALFEVRHDWIETRSAIAYFTHGEPQHASWDKLVSVASEIVSNYKINALPEFPGQFGNLNWLIYALTALTWWFTIIKIAKTKTLPPWILETAIFTIIPLIGFYFLHFNVWYLLGMAPMAVIVTGQAITASPRWLKITMLGLFFLTPILALGQYYTVDRSNHQTNGGMLTIKAKVLDIIWQRTQNGQIPFASYHYFPEIYDYVYQYLYFYAAKTRPVLLPSEFSYQPHETAYIPEKAELLTKFKVNSDPPQKIFYIVQDPGQHNREYLTGWWQKQNFGQIISETHLGDEVILYEATPTKHN